LLTVPNLAHESVPDGADSSANVVVRSVGEARAPFDGVLPHWEIGEKLGILDLEAGARVSGRGFVVFRGDGARLCRALINMMLEIHGEQGYEEVLVPYLVSRASMTGTGQLPKFEEDMYHCMPDDLFLIPTSEVPVTNLERESVVERDRLPIKYTAYSPCFRREAGSYGADTRGLLRVHQFDKVEMVKLTHPASSYDELESLVKDGTAILDALELPYRVVLLCGGDMGFGAAKCYDLETFAPAVGKWLSFFLLELRRLPGAPRRDSPQERRQQVQTRSHTERLRPRAAARRGEHPRSASDAHRAREDSCAPSPLHARAGVSGLALEHGALTRWQSSLLAQGLSVPRRGRAHPGHVALFQSSDLAHAPQRRGHQPVVLALHVERLV